MGIKTYSENLASEYEGQISLLCTIPGIDRCIAITSKNELIDMIENYIRYYNCRRVQHNFGVLTPMEKYNLYLAA